MMEKKNFVWFEEVDKDDVGLVGGKGANLGEMTNAHLPVPYGFILTSKAYFEFIKASNLERKIKELLAIINFENPTELQQASSHIKLLINNADMPKDIAKQAIEYYENLRLKEQQYFRKRITDLTSGVHKLKNVYDLPLVAVRSSATAEDLPTASFAGQQETYLNIKGESHLLVNIKKCWASLFTERAIYYRHQMHFEDIKVGLAVVIQRMVQSEKSGIAFSLDPVSNDKKKIVIEAIFGLGEYIVGGKVTPDHYEVDKNSLVILKKEIKSQPIKLVKSGLKNKEVKLGKKEATTQKLTEEEIVEVALLTRDIEKHYYFPQDIEWAIEGGRVFIVQSRPITTMKVQSSKLKVQSEEMKTPILIGSPASPGIGVGPVKIIYSPKEIDKIVHGDVLVAPQTNPDYVPAMKKAVAIVTEKGGRTSHAAIVSRELGIPAIVGAENATKVLKNEEIATVNGATGEIFKGKVLNPKSEIRNTKLEQRKKIKTITKVYVNLAEPEQARKIAQLDVDGIGLLRAEFMIAQIGTHPKEFIKKNKSHEFIKLLTHDLHKFVSAFQPRPVVYRATDFKTNEYRHLKGGERYEPKEDNPMLGYRGAIRYIAEPDIFAMEIAAIKNIWEQGFRNLHLMIPFVRVPWELIKIKEILKDSGLLDFPGFKLWIMVEVPACALNINEFINIGIDGISIGTNDLTMMLLGVDRDNPDVATIYDERNPIIISVLEYVVKTCVKYGVTASICGQAASDYPEIVEPLVRAGITSVSINPDAIDRTRQLIHDIEKEHFKIINNSHPQTYV